MEDTEIDYYETIIEDYDLAWEELKTICNETLRAAEKLISETDKYVIN